MTSTNPNPLVQQFPCAGCGSMLVFNPKLGQLQCPYCGREELMPQAIQSVQERSFDEYVNANRTQIAALSSTALEAECPGCRAQITFQPPDVAGQCPFCATSIVAQPHTPSPVITPEAVLPFSVDSKGARAGIQKWLGNRWFAPNGLKKMAQQEKLEGVYLPFWTYDCQTASHYSGERGTYYYTTETYTETNSEGKTETKTRQVRHTRWHSVSGQVRRSFDDVLIPAVQSVNLSRLEALEPWDLSKLVPYDSSYLSGFKAQRYQVTLKQGFDTAKDKMKDQIESDVRCDIGGDEQRVHSIATDYSAVSFKHLLLPVWISSYRFRQKQYQVMVNAQTGQVLGDRPYSVVKIGLAVLSGVAAIALFFGAKVQFDHSPQLPTPIPTAPMPSASAPAASSGSTAPSDTAYRQGINSAGNAAALTQSAQTRQDWQEVSNQWAQAIEHMKAVPSSSVNYSTAQQKIGEYQRNLNYARQQVNRAQ